MSITRSARQLARKLRHVAIDLERIAHFAAECKTPLDREKQRDEIRQALDQLVGHELHQLIDALQESAENDLRDLERARD
jgi:glutamyl-tRNA reductase